MSLTHSKTASQGLVSPKSKHDRVEMPPPPHPAISWVVLLLYMAVALEGALVFQSYPWRKALALTDYSAGPLIFESVARAQAHLCGIYVLEIVMALGPGWCAMAPGWTQFELLVHHLPYVAALGICFYGGHADRWTAPMTVVLLTPANEGMFIAASLGAPECLAKFRRLFGFSGVSLLWLCETATLFRNVVLHWQVGTRQAAWWAVLDQIAWGGIYYHAVLLRLYVRRWMKTRSL